MSAPAAKSAEAGPAGTHRRNDTRSRRHMLIPLPLLAFACIGLMLIGAGAALTSSVPLVHAHYEVTATPGQPFAAIVLAKPTYTATPTLAPTPIPVLETEQPVDGMIAAELLSDTPTSEYAPAVGEQEVTYEEPAAPSYSGNKYILVDISEQSLYAYGDGALVYSFVASTGMNNATATGQFSVLDKIPSAYGSTWDIWMPNWLGIYWAGGLENGIHALPILSNGVTLWSGFLGRPISYGCVVLGTYESELLYEWADIGTPVEIQW